MAKEKQESKIDTLKSELKELKQNNAEWTTIKAKMDEIRTEQQKGSFAGEFRNMRKATAKIFYDKEMKNEEKKEELLTVLDGFVDFLRSN